MAFPADQSRLGKAYPKRERVQGISRQKIRNLAYNELGVIEVVISAPHEICLI